VHKPALLEVLNTKAQALDLPQVTDRVLEDWIFEGLMEGPKQKGHGQGPGPEWRYSPEAVTRGFEILRLKASGSRRNAALRLQLWLRDNEVPSDQIRQDLKSEFRRLFRRRFFRSNFSYDARARQRPNERMLKGERRKAGQLDPRLAAAGIELSDNAILKYFSELIWGGGALSQSLDLLATEICTLAPWAPIGAIEEGLSHLKPYADVGGLFGNPDEIEKSGLDDLSLIDEFDLRGGKRFYQGIVSMFKLGRQILALTPSFSSHEMVVAIEAIARTLDESEEWSTAAFALGSIAAFRHRMRTENHLRK
jgi:hypothetical protein